MAPFGAGGIGRIEAKSISPATAKPGQPSEPSCSWPFAMRRRAGPFAFRVEIGMRGDESALLVLGRKAHAVDEVVAVALDMA